jgi:RNA polymerase sigma-32 factor
MTRFALPTMDSERGLSRYFREIWSYPILKPEEEYTFAVRWREDGDIDAAHRLVTSHLRLVAKIASGYRGYGLPMADLISEGNIGLMKAVKKFEPERGFRLATYAMWWIRAAITEYVLRSWSMVKLGTLAAQKKLFFSLGRIKRQLNIMSDTNLSPEQAAEVATAMRVTSQDVVEMDRRLASPDLSLNAPRSREDSDGGEFVDTLVDEAPGPEARAASREEASYRHDLLVQAMASLPERERRIISERQLNDEPMTLEQLGAVYGISRERVRQLEVRALDRLKKAVTALAAQPAEGVPA